MCCFAWEKQRGRERLVLSVIVVYVNVFIHEWKTLPPSLSLRVTVSSVLSHPRCSAVSVKSWSGSDLKAGSGFQRQATDLKSFSFAFFPLVSIYPFIFLPPSFLFSHRTSCWTVEVYSSVISVLFLLPLHPRLFLLLSLFLSFHHSENLGGKLSTFNIHSHPNICTDYS